MNRPYSSVVRVQHVGNVKDAGSIPTSDNCEKKEKPLTGMAQRQRAGLITPRSLDRNGLPVFLHFASFAEAGR